MAEVDHEKNMPQLEHWAKQAIELLDEVKPYRSVFYKQRVAKLKNDFADITHQPSLKCRVKVKVA